VSAPIIAFFNNKGGVGKTSAVYHLAWMYAELGHTVLAADLDPQANLTAAFLDEDSLESLWDDRDRPNTIYRAIRPLIRGTGDVTASETLAVADGLSLLVGDLDLSLMEDDLSDAWPGAMDGRERAFRVLASFWTVLQRSAADAAASLVLVDLGPNLGALNRAALIAADHIVVPLCADVFSLRGLSNLGPRLREWREQWSDRRSRCPTGAPEIPEGTMQPLGYVVLQHSIRLDRPARAYERWVDRIPTVYAEAVLNQPGASADSFASDPNCLGLLKHYRSLMPMAHEARKPIFHLRPADGAIGAHMQGVLAARQDFEILARSIAERRGLWS